MHIKIITENALNKGWGHAITLEFTTLYTAHYVGYVFIDIRHEGEL